MSLFRASNFDIRVYHSGFSLIELLIVVALVAMVGTVASTSLFNILQGISKAEVTKEVKQNGDFALNTIERMIRNAADVTSSCTGTPTSLLTISDIGGNSTTFSCAVDGGAAKIASTSGSMNGFLTTDTVTLGSVCPGTLQFVCARPPNGGKTISISFSLSQKNAEVTAWERASADFNTTISLRNK